MSQEAGKPAVVLAQTRAVLPPDALYANAGYDAEALHVYGREDWGVASVIPAVTQRPDGRVGGTWRAQMTPASLRTAG